jgi:hypothetical protein
MLCTSAYRHAIAAHGIAVDIDLDVPSSGAVLSANAELTPGTFLTARSTGRGDLVDDRRILFPILSLRPGS